MIIIITINNMLKGDRHQLSPRWEDQQYRRGCRPLCRLFCFEVKIISRILVWKVWGNFGTPVAVLLLSEKISKISFKQVAVILAPHFHQILRIVGSIMLGKCFEPTSDNNDPYFGIFFKHSVNYDSVNHYRYVVFIKLMRIGWIIFWTVVLILSVRENIRSICNSVRMFEIDKIIFWKVFFFRNTLTLISRKIVEKVLSSFSVGTIFKMISACQQFTAESYFGNFRLGCKLH